MTESAFMNKAEKILRQAFEQSAYTPQQQEFLYYAFREWPSGVLADWQIRELAENALMITPFVPEKSFEPGHTLSHGLGENSYDVRLSHKFQRYKKDDAPLNPAKFDPKTELFAFDSHAFKLDPHRYVLGVSQEEIWLPPFITGNVENKSTLARFGVDASFTTSLRPGSRNRVTLEIKNHSERPIILHAGDGIASFTFTKMSAPVERAYNGRYNDQTPAQGPAVCCK